MAQMVEWEKKRNGHTICQSIAVFYPGAECIHYIIPEGAESCWKVETSSSVTVALRVIGPCRVIELFDFSNFRAPSLSLSQTPAFGVKDW